MFKAVIFDRDATLNRTTQILRPGQQAGDPTDGYVLSPRELILLPGVSDGIARIRQAGILCFVFTQQNCVSKGLISLSDLDVIHRHMNSLLNHAITAFHVACGPDDPKSKPSPIMITDILAGHGLSRSEVLVVGDSVRDYHAAVAAGVAFAWIRDDLARVSQETMQATGCPIFDDLPSLVEGCILTNSAPAVALPQKQQ